MAPQQAAVVPRLALRSYIWVSGAGAQGRWGAPVMVAVVQVSPWNPILWRAGWGAAHRDGRQGEGCKHADTLKAQKSLEGAWMGAGQDRTVLNSFSLKSFLGLQFFFSFPFHFFKKLRE